MMDGIFGGILAGNMQARQAQTVQQAQAVWAKQVHVEFQRQNAMSGPTLAATAIDAHQCQGCGAWSADPACDYCGNHIRREQR